DGLLAARFDRDDMSDARRRGYEADAPWRFASASVARVHRALLDASARGEIELLDVLDAALDEAEGISRPRAPVRPRAEQRSPGAPQGPQVVALSLTRACNQACAFCIARGRDAEPPEARAARAVRSVRAAARAGARTVVLGGAEPTLDRFLPALADHAR